MPKFAALLLALAVAGSARAEPANNFDALFAGINTCLKPLRLAEGTDVTILFSLNRRGGIIGQPRLTHVHWGKTADPKRDAQAIAEGFNKCLPAEISDAFGGAIAGRLFTYRLRVVPGETRT